MRRIHLPALLIPCLLTAWGCAKIEQSSPRPSVEGPAALIEDGARTHSFGALVTNTGKRLEHRYRLVNGSGADLKIVEVVNRKPCCGVVKIDKTVLRPGEGADVEVSIRVADKLGEVVHETEVVTDPPARSEIVLRTLARAYPPLRIEELGTRSGTVALGAAAPKGEFRAVAHGSAEEPPIDLGRVELASTTKAEWLGPAERGNGEEGLIVATRRFAVLLDSDGSIGRKALEIGLRDGSGFLLEHVIHWEVATALTANPKVVVFSAQRRVARILLRAGDGQAFRVLKVECPAGVSGHSSSAEPRSEQVVEVKLDGRAKLDGVRGALSVRIDHPAVQSVEVPVMVLD